MGRAIAIREGWGMIGRRLRRSARAMMSGLVSAGCTSIEAGNLTATTVRASNATQTDAAGPALDFFLERYMPAHKAEFAEFVPAIKEARDPAGWVADDAGLVNEMRSGPA